MRRITFCLFLFFASHFLWASETNQNIINSFYLIPYGEQSAIKELFRDLFKAEEFAYSIFGDKPMSLSDSLLNQYSANQLLEFLSLENYCSGILEIYSEPSEFLNKRWEVWKKYKNRFKLKKYLLLEKKIGKQVRIFIINIDAFNKVVNQHINLFRQIIDSKLSAESLLAQFEDERTNVFDILHHHKGLLGILLGFGKHNSMLFQKREDLTTLLNNPLIEHSKIQKKLKTIDNKLQTFCEHDAYIIASINRVMFVADPAHPETIQLRKKYDKLNKKINSIYYKDDWFEQTLIQLTSN